MAITINDLLPYTNLLTRVNKSIMVHDTTLPLNQSTILVTLDNLKEQIQELTQNGLTINSGNTELGGALLHPTIITLDGNIMLFQQKPTSAFGYYPFGTSDQYLMYTELEGYGAFANSLEENQIGNKYVGSSVGIRNNTLNIGKGFSNKYYEGTGEIQSYWHYNTNAESFYVSIDDQEGLTITPYDTGGTNPFLGDLLSIYDSTQTKKVAIKNNGTIVVDLPTHVDEAAATTAGLLQNTIYKTPTGELRIKL